MSCGGHAFLHHGVAQAACLEKARRRAQQYTCIQVATKSLEMPRCDSPSHGGDSCVNDFLNLPCYPET
jgi:hypothetical protein